MYNTYRVVIVARIEGELVMLAFIMFVTCLLSDCFVFDMCLLCLRYVFVISLLIVAL